MHERWARSGVVETTISVLLVDDDQDEAILLRTMLRHTAYAPGLLRMQLHWVATYEDALLALAHNEYQAALVDYHLGAHTGIDLLRAINQRGLRLPVILLTGAGSHAIDMAAMQEGAADYLLKGQFDAHLLERAIRYAIEQRRTQDELEMRVRERDLLLNQLSIEQSRLQAVIANAASGIVMADASGKVILANPIAEQLLGSALRIGEVLHLPATASPISAQTQFLTQAAQMGQPSDNIELVLPLPQAASPEGGQRYLLASASPIYDTHGLSSGAVGVFQDITARKQMEEDLQRRAARSQLLTLITKTFFEAGLNDQSVLDTVTREIANQLANACVIRLLTPDQQWLVAASAYCRAPDKLGELQQAMSRTQLHAEDGLSGGVLRTGTPVMLTGFHAPAKHEAIPAEFAEWHQSCPIHSLLIVPLHIKERALGVLILMRQEDEAPFNLEDLRFFEDLASRAALAIENARLYEEVQMMSLTDPLTGLYNRRGLLSLSESELNRARRLKQQVAVILIDIDHFKIVNDTFGHLIGDKVLQVVAGRLRGALRNQDILARYGGEEFAIVLPECCSEMGESVAERLRCLFAGQTVQTEGASVNITISLGMIVTEPTSEDLNDLLALADQALYSAKENGRNRVGVYLQETWHE